MKQFMSIKDSAPRTEIVQVRSIQSARETRGSDDAMARTKSVRKTLCHLSLLIACRKV